ncbi:hypothetical protein EDD85DRAFT_957060 [Armillaria nabsnona]|nr:hypothetical protein EDD85DRAFT_957060 [Armillaria nabsnona]
MSFPYNPFSTALNSISFVFNVKSMLLAVSNTFILYVYIPSPTLICFAIIPDPCLHANNCINNSNSDTDDLVHDINGFDVSVDAITDQDDQLWIDYCFQKQWVQWQAWHLHWFHVQPFDSLRCYYI